MIDYKNEAIKQWTFDPCGIHAAKGMEIGTRDFFERIDQSRYEEYAPWMQSTFEFERFAGQKVLEIGFGMGTDLFQFAKAGANASGIELSPEHMRIALKRFELYGIAADLRLADAETLPFGDSSFDCIYSFGVLHHIPNTSKVVDEIYRVLRPGGRVLIGVYHRWSLYFFFSVLLPYLTHAEFLRESFQGKLSKIEYRENSAAQPFVRLYSRTSLRKLLHKFSEIEITSKHLTFFGRGRHIPKWIIHRLEQAGMLGWYLVAKGQK
jgi:ubiquinone/menaquinone biosynthesis C-methylase UbiE